VIHQANIVTIIEGVEVAEITAYDRGGHPIERYYQIRGEKFETLTQATKAVRGDR